MGVEVDYMGVELDSQLAVRFTRFFLPFSMCSYQNVAQECLHSKRMVFGHGNSIFNPYLFLFIRLLEP